MLVFQRADEVVQELNVQLMYRMNILASYFRSVLIIMGGDKINKSNNSE